MADDIAKIEYSVGIDPGWTNLGLALVGKGPKGLFLCMSKTLCPRDLGGQDSISKAVGYYVQKALTEEGTKTDAAYPPALNHLDHLVIERYVSYNGVQTSESENILMLIGALRESLRSFYAPELTLYRAIDWKMKLVKHLVRTKGFDNPSNSLDKKFSIAAAKSCLDVKGEFESDHEADAICLASIPLFKDSTRS